MKNNKIIWQFLTASQRNSVADKVRKTKDKKLIDLIFNECEELTVAVLQNPMMKEYDVDSLVDRPDPNIREYVAETTKNPDILAKLAYDEDENVVESVCINPHFNSPEAMRHVLKKWKRGSSSAPRFLINNKSCPTEILTEVARGRDKYLVRVAISTERLPVQELERLCRSRDSSIRERIAELETLPLHIGEKLARDPEFDVRNSCISGLRDDGESPLFAIFMKDKDRSIREDVFRYCTLPEVLKAGLENETDFEVMFKVMKYGKSSWGLPKRIGTEAWEAVIFKFIQIYKSGDLPDIYNNDWIIKEVVEGSTNVSLLFEAYSVVEEEAIKQLIKRMIDNSGELENWAISLDEWT